MDSPVKKMLEVRNIVKRYGSVVAVDGASFYVDEGEVFGLLGPNGAGKSTTIRMLTTLTKPTSGELYVAGYSVNSEQIEVKRRIGVVPQQNNFELELTGRENLLLHALLHKMPKNIREARVAELLAYVGLEDRADDRVRDYSGGMARRLIIARSLLHGPSILFLDEPTVGLDPQTRRKIWDLILLMNRSGVTVLLTTHYIEEAESLCHRVGIMDYGKLIALDSPEKLKQNVGNCCVEFLRDFGIERHFFATRQEAQYFASEQGCDAVVRRTNLEDVFVELTGRVGKDFSFV